MKKQFLLLLSASALAIGMATPSNAENALNSVGSFFGSVTATIIDVPEGIVVDSLYRVPKKTWHYLADKFGNENGGEQNIAGAMLGIPAGFVMGIPYGAIHGGKHGWSTGWEKPFSTESYLVPDDDK